MVKLHTQQGNCILEVVEVIPETAKRLEVKTKRYIVLKGKGVNTHEVETSGIEVYEDKGVLYLKTSKEVKLIHQEHGTITLKPNKIYKRIIEREFDYEGMEARQTID